jgi:Tc5 transposase DNA-binding domain
MKDYSKITVMSEGWIFVELCKVGAAADPRKRDEKKVHTHRPFKVEHINKPMVEWVKTERVAGRAVSRASIAHKAIAVNAHLGGPATFVASRGWLECFMNR